MTTLPLIMPATLEDFSAIAEGQSDNTHVRMGFNGPQVPGSKLSSLMDNFQSDRNRTAFAAFHTALSSAYTQQIAVAAFAKSELDQKQAAGSPMTVHRMKDAMQTAADMSYREKYIKREDNVRGWTPSDNNPSKVQHEAMRYSCSDQGGMRIHGWHLQQHGNNTEFDDLLRAEMQALPGGMNPEQKNIQARINLLDSMLGQAEQHLALAQDGSPQFEANLFTAPEWLFAGANVEIDGSGNLVTVKNAGAMSEQEKLAVDRGLKALSTKHPNMIIAAGSTLWSKPVDGLHPGADNIPVHADMVFNSSSVLVGGQKVHSVEKHNDGGDAKMAADGLHQRRPHDKPDASNKFGARLQVFANDSVAPNKDSAIRQQAKTMNRPDPGENNFFRVGNKTVCLEICADHSNSNPVAKRSHEDAKAQIDAGNSLPPGKAVLNQVIQENGADMHIVIAAGAGMQVGKCLAKVGSPMCVNDMAAGTLLTATRASDEQVLSAPDKNGVRHPLNSTKSFGGSLITCDKKDNGVTLQHGPARNPHPLQRSTSVRDLYQPGGKVNTPKLQRSNSMSRGNA